MIGAKQYPGFRQRSSPSKPCHSKTLHAWLTLAANLLLRQLLHSCRTSLVSNTQPLRNTRAQPGFGVLKRGPKPCVGSRVQTPHAKQPGFSLRHLVALIHLTNASQHHTYATPHGPHWGPAVVTVSQSVSCLKHTPMIAHWTSTCNTTVLKSCSLHSLGLFGS